MRHALVLVAILAASACTVRSSLLTSETSPPAPAAGSAAPAPSEEAPVAAHGCPNSDAGDVPELFDQAPVIAPGSNHGCISGGASGEDIDTFAVRAPANSGGVLYTLDFTGEMYMTAKVFDADRNRIATAHANKDARGQIWIAVAGETTFYVQLKANRNRHQGKAYTTELTAQLIDDPDEPNNERTYATPLALGTPHSGVLQLVANAELGTDWYRVEVDRPGTLDIVLSDAPQNATFIVQVYDRDNRRTRTRNGSGRNPGSTVRATVELESPGSYFLEVRAWHGGRKRGHRGAPLQHAFKKYRVTATLR